MTPEFVERTIKELQYAESKHPGFPTDRIHASAILNEEAGKLTQACIDFEFGNVSPEDGYAQMEKYAARVSAMANRFFMSLPKK